MGQTLSIAIDRTWRGLYQYTLGLPGVGEESYGSISMKAAKLEIGVRSQESGARRKEEEGRRKEPEEVFLQI